MVRKHRKNPAK